VYNKLVYRILITQYFTERKIYMSLLPTTLTAKATAALRELIKKELGIEDPSEEEMAALLEKYGAATGHKIMVEQIMDLDVELPKWPYNVLNKQTAGKDDQPT